jgi:hypothetical protein
MFTTNKRLACVSVLLLSLTAGATNAGVLIAGRDTEDFANSVAKGGIDQLAKTTTAGAVAGATALINTNYQVNGIGDKGGGVLYAGSAVLDNFLTIDYDGNLLTTGTSAGYKTTCCNEDIAYDPLTNTVYRGSYSAAIVAVNGTTGALISTDPEEDVVGMAHVNGEIWISKWRGREVGTWDPLTGLYTKKFDTDGAGGINGNAGGLAFDPDNQILWIGFQGGLVTPWSLTTGTRLGDGYQPFGPMDETIDGLVFLGESRSVPEPASLLLVALGLVAAATRRRLKVRA